MISRSIPDALAKGKWSCSLLQTERIPIVQEEQIFVSLCLCCVSPCLVFPCHCSQSRMLLSPQCRPSQWPCLQWGSNPDKILDRTWRAVLWALTSLSLLAQVRICQVPKSKNGQKAEQDWQQGTIFVWCPAPFEHVWRRLSGPESLWWVEVP